MNAPQYSQMRRVAWAKDEPFGAEFVEVRFGDGLRAIGTAIGSHLVPHRLDYDLLTDSHFVTVSLDITSMGERWSRSLHLSRSSTGQWRSDYAETGIPPFSREPPPLSGLESALDCDLGLCPITNVLPIRRHNLLSRADTVELTMAWVSTPELHVIADGQRYTGSSDGSLRVRYEAMDRSFEAVIQCDRDGLPVDYPGIARRLNNEQGAFKVD